METTLIDYSSLYYRTIKKSVVPWKRRGKFVQIRKGNKEYLIISLKGLSSYHSHIVGRFSDSQKIEGFYNKYTYTYEFSNEEWKVIGGGKWMINDKEKVLLLYDESGCYGKFEPSGLKKRIMESGFLSGYEVQIS